MSARRTISAVFALTSLCGLAACGSNPVTSATTVRAGVGALGDDEVATYEYVVPYGTSVRIDQGQLVDIMPRLLEVKVNQSIRIRNRDGRDYTIGPFFVGAGQTLAMRFTHEGQLSGMCTMNPEGEFLIKVSK